MLSMKSNFSLLVDGLNVLNDRIVHYDDWLVFDRRLNNLIEEGRARKIPTLKMLYMPDEEWYMDSSSGEVYVYVRPDDKILPRWSPVDVFALPEQSKCSRTGLDAIPVRRMSELQAASLKEFLKVLVEQGLAKIIDAPAGTRAATPGEEETWYKDSRSDLDYRLVLDSGGTNSRWEFIPHQRLISDKC
jgi:hypothetical protein